MTPVHQEGLALLISVVVLLVLTIVALAATDSNQLQSLMMRNAQFRMEAFNASYTEIDAQVDSINARDLSEEETEPTYLRAIIDGRRAGVVASTVESSSVQLELQAPTEPDYMQQDVEQKYLVQCDVFGERLGAGQGNVQCASITISSGAQFTDRASIRSDQRQVYNYKYLGEQ